MSTATIKSSFLQGEVTAPSSKSVAHRMMICAALSGKKCYIKNVSKSDDMTATIGCLSELGAKITFDNSTVFVDATEFAKDKKKHYTLNCKESGTTVRIMIPLCASLGLNVTFTGEGRLPLRPLDEYLELFKQHSVKVEKGENYLPLTISGKLTGDFYEVSPKVSSQYVTGLLFAQSLLQNDSTLSLSSELLGSQYVDITLSVMRKFGVNIEKCDNSYKVFGAQSYKAKDEYSDENIGINVEGDWSQAAFFLCAGAINGDITVNNLDINSTQGDKAIVEILKSFNADIEVRKNSVKVRKSELKSTTIDATDTPDLVPVVAVLSAFANGETNITGVSRLKFKESDRLLSTTNMIKSLGGNATYTDDVLTVYGNGKLIGGKVDSYNDHRIVMSSAVASLVCENDTVINDAQAVNKSYSDFFNDYNSLGGKADVNIR